MAAQDWGMQLQGVLVQPDRLDKMLGGGSFGKVFALRGDSHHVVKMMLNENDWLQELRNLNLARSLLLEDEEVDQGLPTGLPEPVRGLFAGVSTHVITRPKQITPTPTLVYSLKLERIPCGTLATHRDLFPGSFEDIDVVRIVLQIIIACERFAIRGFAHCDLAPANLAFRDGPHHLVLLDLGLMGKFGPKGFLGTMPWRTLRYARTTSQSRGRGPVTMFSDVESALYTGLVLLGATWEELYDNKLNPLGLIQGLRIRLPRERWPLLNLLQAFLLDVQVADARENTFEWNEKTYHDVVSPFGKKLRLLVGIETVDQIYGPIFLEMFDLVGPKFVAKRNKLQPPSPLAAGGGAGPQVVPETPSLRPQPRDVGADPDTRARPTCATCGKPKLTA